MAIRINRVYTRSGDDGRTALVGGRRVAKDDARIAAYGDVDELNCVLGVVRTELAEPPYSENHDARALDRTLAFLQQELFDLGSELATPPDAVYEGMIRIGDEQVTRLEGYIDALQPDLEPLNSFVLPGGGRAGAALHLARTVCRRAERLVTTLVRDGDAEPGPARYLNRLSDLLFVQARWIAAKTGHAETLWQHGLEPPAAEAKAKARSTKAGKTTGGRKR
jgi:cob(I)alamin adenosyltransferase